MQGSDDYKRKCGGVPCDLDVVSDYHIRSSPSPPLPVTTSPPTPPPTTLDESVPDMVDAVAAVASPSRGTHTPYECPDAEQDFSCAISAITILRGSLSRLGVYSEVQDELLALSDDILRKARANGHAAVNQTVTPRCDGHGNSSDEDDTVSYGDDYDDDESDEDSDSVCDDSSADDSSKEGDSDNSGDSGECGGEGDSSAEGVDVYDDDDDDDDSDGDTYNCHQRPAKRHCPDNGVLAMTSPFRFGLHVGMGLACAELLCNVLASIAHRRG